MTKQFTSNAEVTLDKLADDIAYRSEKFLKPVEDAVAIGVALLAEDLLDINDDRELELFFQAQLNNIEWLSGMFLGRSDGSFVFVARNRFGMRSKLIKIEDGVRYVEIIQRDGGGKIVESWIDTGDEYDPRTRVWYKNAMANTSKVWTEPYTFFSSGLPGMSVSSKAGSNSVLGADVNINELSEYTASIPNSSHGSAVIIDDAQNTIAYDQKSVITPGPEYSGVPRVEHIVDPALRSLHAKMQARELSSPDKQQHIITTVVGDRSHLGLTRSFSLLDDALDWTLLAQVPADDYAGGALSLLNRQTRTLGFLTLSLALLTVLGVFGLHWAARTTATKNINRTNGVLNFAEFESRLENISIQHSDSTSSGNLAVMVIECQNLKYLADRSGQSLNSDILQSLAIKVVEHLGSDDFLCCTDHDRILVSLTANNNSEVQQRIKNVDQATASAGVLETPDGKKRLTFATGAAIHEPGAPMSNLLHRAREALALGLEESTNGVRMADCFFSADDKSIDRAA